MTPTPLRFTLARRPAPGLWQPRRWLLALVWALWVLATLAPGLSRLGAHARATPADWVEVCTSHGMVWARSADAPPAIEASAEPSDPVSALLSHLDACAHCALALDRFTPPLPPALGWLGLSLPPQRVASAIPLWHWAAPVPEFAARGPPLAS
jgi:hypothetical protein